MEKLLLQQKDKVAISETFWIFRKRWGFFFIQSNDDDEELSNKKRTKKIKKVKIIQTCEELPKDELECIDVSGELEEEDYV